MTAKQEIAQWLRQIPEDLTIAETLGRLQSINDAKQEKIAKAETPAGEAAESLSPPLDGEGIKNEILNIIARLPDDLTMAEAVCESADRLRLFYFIEKDFQDIREGRALPYDQRDYTPIYRDEVPEIGRIPYVDFERMTVKEKLAHTVKLMPGDMGLGQAVFESLDRMLLVYGIEKSMENGRKGKSIPHEEVVRMFQKKWQA